MNDTDTQNKYIKGRHNHENVMHQKTDRIDDFTLSAKRSNPQILEAEVMWSS